MYIYIYIYIEREIYIYIYVYVIWIAAPQPLNRLPFQRPLSGYLGFGTADALLKASFEGAVNPKHCVLLVRLMKTTRGQADACGLDFKGEDIDSRQQLHQ